VKTEAPLILFDVMDTLVHEPFHTEIPAFFGMTLEELRAVKHPTAWIDFEKGLLDEATYLARFFLDGRPFDHAGLLACLRRAYRWIDGMQPLLAELAGAGHSIHALSNYSVWYRLIEEQLQLSRHLAWSFVSCDTGVRKPDPKAYTGAAETLGVAPSACLFIDDREVNCAAARETGMPAVRFTSAPELRRELAARGLTR